MRNSFNFDKTSPYVIALTPMKAPLIADICLVLHSQYIHKACNDVVCPLGRRYFLKKVVPSCSKCEITYRFSKTLENTYEGLQFSEVTACNFTKNRLLHRYEAKISEAHSQKFAAFFQFI